MSLITGVEVRTFGFEMQKWIEVVMSRRRNYVSSSDGYGNCMCSLLLQLCILVSARPAVLCTGFLSHVAGLAGLVGA